MDPAVAAGAASAGSSVLAAGLSLYGQKKQRDWEEEQAAIERQWNEQMLDKQNQFSLDMWNRTNEYNDPSKQYERLKTLVSTRCSTTLMELVMLLLCSLRLFSPVLALLVL